MAEFDFPYHLTETVNPDNSFRVALGNGWEYATETGDADQRIFKLSFQGMKFFVDAAGQIDENFEPQRNMKTLIDFYHSKKLYRAFTYEHPVYGVLSVRFNRPLPEPKPMIGGGGVVEEFVVELRELP